MSFLLPRRGGPESQHAGARLLPPPLLCSQAAVLPFTGDLRAGRHCRDHQLRISAPRGPGWPARPSRPRHFQPSYSPPPPPRRLLLVSGVAPLSSGSRNSSDTQGRQDSPARTDPPWFPEVLLDGRRAQRDVHLKGARWYFTRSRPPAVLPCSLFPGAGGSRPGSTPCPASPKSEGASEALASSEP